MNIYQKAIEKFGQESQLLMAIEEMAELMQAISKCQRGMKSNIEEEIADVKIMISQLEEMFDKDNINLWKEEKLNRLNELLEG